MLTVLEMERVIALLEEGTAKPENYPERVKMIEKLKVECSRSYAKENGKTDLQKALEKVVYKRDIRPVLQAPWTDEKGITYATDTYQALKIMDTSGLKLKENRAVKEGYTPPNMDRLFPTNFAAEEELPTLAELKEHMTKAKAMKKISVYVFDNFKVMVNSEFLVNGILATGETKAKLNGQMKPLVIENDNVTYMGMGIKPTGNEDIIDGHWAYIEKK